MKLHPLEDRIVVRPNTADPSTLWSCRLAVHEYVPASSFLSTFSMTSVLSLNPTNR